jgi:hypothetical protein
MATPPSARNSCSPPLPRSPCATSAARRPCCSPATGVVRPGARQQRAGATATRPARDLGYCDAYRAVHGYESSESSWTWKRIAGHNGGWRIDHIFAPTALQPIACLYHHALARRLASAITPLSKPTLPGARRTWRKQATRSAVDSSIPWHENTRRRHGIELRAHIDLCRCPAGSPARC